MCSHYSFQQRIDLLEPCVELVKHLPRVDDVRVADAFFKLGHLSCFLFHTNMSNSSSLYFSLSSSVSLSHFVYVLRNFVAKCWKLEESD